MTDLASLQIVVDSSQVKTGTAALDGLTAAGTRAEAATTGLRGGVKGVGVEAAAMASAAQLSARAAMDQAAGFGAATTAARANTLAMRETLVVARELARGNFTRIPGSLTLLAQGVGSQGGIAAFASSLGIIKQVQNAELSEAATAAATAAAAVENAARRAAANVIAADTEVALAEAAVRVAATSQAEAAAQVRLAAATEAVTAAAAEATIAENALAAAQGRVMETGAASAAATTTTLGTTGAVLVAVGIAATGATLGFEALKKSVSDSGVLKDYADSLGLSAKQMDALKEKTNDFALTFGDVWHGVKQAAEDALDQSDGWQKFKAGNESAFKAALQDAVNFAAAADGYVGAAYDVIVNTFEQLPAALGSSFVAAVNVAIDEINKLVKAAVDGINFAIHAANNIPGIHIGDASAPAIGHVSGVAPPKPTLSFSQDAAKRTAEAKAKIESGLDTIYGDIIGAAEERIKKAGGNPPKGKNAPKPKQNPADEELQKLDAQIKGQNELASAYLISDAAAIKAEADQKALTLAVEKHATAAQTAALKEKELALAIATATAEGAKKVAGLRDQGSALRTVNAMVAAGLIPAAQANQQLQLETELQPLNAALALAQGDAKTKLLQVIQDLVKAQTDYNAQVSVEQALKQEAANDNDIAKMQLENSLLGASNKERAVAVAQLEAIQQLQSMPGLSPRQQQDFIQSAINKAALSVQTPFQQWAATVPQTADAINEALQSIETKGFDTLAQSIAGVITGTESLGQAFKDISQQIIGDLVQMIDKMLLFRALSSVFGGASAGTGLGGGGLPDAGAYTTSFLGLHSALGNVFSRGGLVPFATGGIVTGPTLFPMSGGQTGVMGEAGPEAVMPLTRDGQGRLGVRAANSNVPQVVEIHVVRGEMFETVVQQISGAVTVKYVEAASPAIARGAAAGVLKTMSRPKLMGTN